MPSATISVLIPCYRQERFLSRALESVLTQKGVDFDVLVSDDASPDGTAEVARRFAALDPRVRLVRHEKNLGMAANWNWCLEQARGRFIKYVFGDDFLTTPDTLACLQAPLLEDPRIALVTSARQIVDADGHTVAITRDFPETCRLPGSEAITRCLLGNRNLIGEPSTVLFRREAARPFDNRFRQLIDIEFWFCLLRSGDLAYIGQPLCAFRRHDGQQTSHNRASRAGEFEGVALFAQNHDLIDAYLAAGGSHRLVRIAAFNTLYQARKSSRRPGWIAGAEQTVSAYLPGAAYQACWLEHKLMKPLKNLGRLVSRATTAPSA